MTTDFGAAADVAKGVHVRLNRLEALISMQAIILALGIMLGAFYLHHRGVK